MPPSYTLRPEPTEYAPYYARYINLIPPGDIMAHLAAQQEETLTFLRQFSEEDAGYRYAPDKWSVKQVVGHLIDGELIFGYRALAFSRKEPNPLPGFDQDDYVAAANFDQRAWHDLVDAFYAARTATLWLFRGMTDAMMEQTGVASNNPVSVRALAYIMAGHERHHVKILRERYVVT